VSGGGGISEGRRLAQVPSARDCQMCQMKKTWYDAWDDLKQQSAGSVKEIGDPGGRLLDVV